MAESTFCSQCGAEFQAAARFCSMCAAPAAAASVPGRARLVRPRHPRMLAGVCSGVAIFYGWDVSLVRILYAIFVCLSVGIGLLAYAVAWVVMPDAQYALPAATQRQGNVV